MSASSSTTRILPLEALTVLSSTEGVSGIHRVPLRCLRAPPGFGPGDLEVETSAAAGTIVSFNRACMLLHNTVRHRKPEPGPLARRLGGEERIVDAVKIFGLDAVTGVHYVHARAMFIGRSFHFEHAARFHCVPRVHEQIQKDLLEFSGIGVYRSQRRIQLRAD